MASSTELACYRCGSSLAKLTPPISRQDECPECSVYLHVCRMCRFFRKDVPRQCTEDGAEEVIEKERLNFCDWYQPSAEAFDPGKIVDESRAHGELASLFGGDEVAEQETGAGLQDAEDLFK